MFSPITILILHEAKRDITNIRLQVGSFICCKRNKVVYGYTRHEISTPLDLTWKDLASLLCSDN